MIGRQATALKSLDLMKFKGHICANLNVLPLHCIGGNLHGKVKAPVQQLRFFLLSTPDPFCECATSTFLTSPSATSTDLLECGSHSLAPQCTTPHNTFIRELDTYIRATMLHVGLRLCLTGTTATASSILTKLVMLALPWICCVCLAIQTDLEEQVKAP